MPEFRIGAATAIVRPPQTAERQNPIASDIGAYVDEKIVGSKGHADEFTQSAINVAGRYRHCRCGR